ncbi:patatin-like protein [Novosphingobium humi]|uniref:patatin-like protein n=1 Tax=Novosphingobium humi TaxID=2282397 RepID=UPI0025B0C656|nr:patatin-like protein [Novosphingobium humi]WJS99428.1 patatin-like protein [Novosphingobium humi]
MRHKELRLALVCYGGISLAVYMHGVTKEVWKLARASRLRRSPDNLLPSERIYADLLNAIADRTAMQLRVLPDIVAGASAGGLNGVFLAQAIHSGQSLEPLTRLWLERADIDCLLDPDDRGWTGFAKQWAVPLVRMLLSRTSPISHTSSAIEDEIRAKLNRLVRSRWFEAPFSGIGFSRLIAEALDAMAGGACGVPLLPRGHPLDLFTTATDYAGHPEKVALHSPPWVEEREHRVDISFRANAGYGVLAPLPELVFAARASASFPGAFPPLLPVEIDRLMAERDEEWSGRAAFLSRVLPAHFAAGTVNEAALMDGSILVNAPFAQAIAALPSRPAEREVDRRLLYIDPTQDAVSTIRPTGAPGFFSVIFRAISTIPREQPIRDNLEALARQSADMARVRQIMAAIQPEVEASVRLALGRDVLNTCPDGVQMAAWRQASHAAAVEQAGFAYQAYARMKLEITLDALAQALTPEAPMAAPAEQNGAAIRQILGRWAHANLRPRGTGGQSMSSEMLAFLRSHDGGFRLRRMRHLIRRLEEAREELTDVSAHHHDAARDAAWQGLSLALGAASPIPVDSGRVLVNPGEVLREMASAGTLPQLDARVDALLVEAIRHLPAALGQVMLLAYLGFAFYDVATLTLTRGQGEAEMNPVKIDRISPRDVARGTSATGLSRRLKGEEFHHFAAFFSRAYREHDYLMGRLHGAARMVDLLNSTAPGAIDPQETAAMVNALFGAILDEEQGKLTADSGLIESLRAELLIRPH